VGQDLRQRGRRKTEAVGEMYSSWPSRIRRRKKWFSRALPDQDSPRRQRSRRSHPSDDLQGKHARQRPSFFNSRTHRRVVLLIIVSARAGEVEDVAGVVLSKEREVSMRVSEMNSRIVSGS